jgi:hypothetical protein
MSSFWAVKRREWADISQMWKSLLGVSRKIPDCFRQGGSNQPRELKEIACGVFIRSSICFASKASIMAVSSNRLIITAHASYQPDSKQPFIWRPDGYEISTPGPDEQAQWE